MLIAVLNTKGGCGKSTVSINIAAALSYEGADTLLVDTDDTGTSLSWSTMRGDGEFSNLTVVAIPNARALRGELGKLRTKYDHIVVDGAPHLEELLTASVAVADQVIIPVFPSPNDLWKLGPMITHIQRTRAMVEEITGRLVRTHFLLNGYQSRTRLSKEALAVLAELEFPTLESRLALRVDYRESLSEGTAAIGFKNQKARAEIIGLLRELKSLDAA